MRRSYHQSVQANPAGRDGIERCVYRAALAVDRLKLDLLGPKERNIGDEEVSTKPMPKSCHRFSQTSSSLSSPETPLQDDQ